MEMRSDHIVFINTNLFVGSIKLSRDIFIYDNVSMYIFKYETKYIDICEDITERDFL